MEQLSVVKYKWFSTIFELNWSI